MSNTRLNKQYNDQLSTCVYLARRLEGIYDSPLMLLCVHERAHIARLHIGLRSSFIQNDKDISLQAVNALMDYLQGLINRELYVLEHSVRSDVFYLLRDIRFNMKACISTLTSIKAEAGLRDTLSLLLSSRSQVPVKQVLAPVVQVPATPMPVLAPLPAPALAATPAPAPTPTPIVPVKYVPEVKKPTVTVERVVPPSIPSTASNKYLMIAIALTMAAMLGVGIAMATGGLSLLIGGIILGTVGLVGMTISVALYKRKAKQIKQTHTSNNRIVSTNSQLSPVFGKPSVVAHQAAPSTVATKHAIVGSNNVVDPQVENRLRM